MARKILLADDSVTAQNMGRKILADAGYDVVTVNNGSAALKRIAESQPDLIILDVYMPGYSGLEVCQRLKDAGETAHIPVLLSVGKLEPFKPQEARRVRADAHIVKPFEASQLLTAIARLEDQMVPQQKGSRFATSGGTASMDDPFTRPDEGRILGRGGKLSKKNKDTSERGDPLASGDDQLSPQAASFRDFKKKAKSQAATSAPVEYSSESAEPVSHEPGPLAKLPGDITAEELSALSEVAAQLNEAAPAAQGMPSSGKTFAETAGDKFGETSVATPAETADSQLEAEVARLPVVGTPISATPVSEAAEGSTAAPAHEEHKTESAESIEPPRPAVKNWEVSAVAKKEIEIPVAELEPANNFAPANEVAAASEQVGQVESSQDESSQVGSPRVESPTAESSQDSDARLPDAVSMASFAQEPAPVDQQDEPMFASAHAEQAYADETSQTGAVYTSRSESSSSAEAVETVNLDKDEKKEEFVSIDSSFAQAVFAESTSTVTASAERVPTESSPAEVPAPESISFEAEPATATATTTDDTAEPEAPMPSDAALAEALSLLTPASAQAEPATEPVEPVLAASQRFENEETMDPSGGKRWVAEAMTLTPEETAMSLEAEMFRSFAASAEKIEALPVENPLAAIQLAVENRLAAEAADAVATAQSESTGQSAPRAMAAVAPAGVASATSAESEIASIVDKVMADLRPKIVEEITRKLAGK